MDLDHLTLRTVLSDERLALFFRDVRFRLLHLDSPPPSPSPSSTNLLLPPPSQNVLALSVFPFFRVDTRLVPSLILSFCMGCIQTKTFTSGLPLRSTKKSIAMKIAKPHLHLPTRSLTVSDLPPFLSHFLPGVCLCRDCLFFHASRFNTGFWEWMDHLPRR